VSFNLNNIVPWGRSFDEYAHMFDLDARALSGRFLDCAGGPANFNAEATLRGLRVMSCDPLYGASAQEIQRRIEETYPTMMEQLRQNQHDYLWETIPRQALTELCRVAGEVRIFPIIDMAGRRSSYVDSLTAECISRGFETTLVTVRYEFRKGANQMLRISRPQVP